MQHVEQEQFEERKWVIRDRQYNDQQKKWVIRDRQYNDQQKKANNSRQKT